MTPIRKKPDDVKGPRWLQLGWPGSKLLLYGIEFTLLFALAAGFGFAQAAAEYGSTMSGMAGSMSKINLMNKVKLPDLSSNGNPTVIMSKPTAQTNSNYILDSMKKGSVTINRKDLEQHAGAKAAKLMLRSSPTDAFVKVDGKPVGRTPILLVVAPGRYDVTMDGKRMDHAEQKIDLLPKETREFLLTLKQLYPTQVMVQLH